MKCYVFAVNEPTLDTCVWSLERNGWEVIVYQDNTSLWAKLKRLYNEAEDGFARVDADVIVNRSFAPDRLRMDADYWWAQYCVFDWYQQDISTGGAQILSYEALPALKYNIGQFEKAERPESQMYRLDEFHNPRRCITIPDVVGLHGYGIKDLDPVRATKKRRHQEGNYDFVLAEKLNEIV